MKINISVKRPGVGVQIFDALYAYLQSLNTDNNNSVIEIKFDDIYSSTDLNILFEYMPQRNYSEKELEKYDLIFLCNGGEPLQVSTDSMVNLLTIDNVYLIANSYLADTHPLKHKVIYFPSDIQLCRDYWTRYFYPQYFENIKNKLTKKTSNLVAINGSIRTNRHYFFKLLQQQVPSLTLTSRLGTTIHTLNESQWESEEDTEFREWVNDQYCNQSTPQPDQYYNNSVNIGIDAKFGEVLPGYFVMPEYFKYACVIFPETAWQNNELAVTEKALKCFYAGSLPFPVSGANVNQFYNNIGFYTAWNLLPDDIKLFDQVTDHKNRYSKAIEAIKWLDDNSYVFEGEQFKYMIIQNQVNFLTNECNSNLITQLYNIIKSKLPIDILDKI